MIPVRCRAGDLVEVRPAAEILATLDGDGCLDGLPFMPEMLQYCGRRFRVFRSAHKTCDSTHYRDGRYMDEAVFLEDLRCDGSGHDGCEASCLLFFKLAWLKAVSPARDWGLPAPPPAVPGRDAAWLAATVRRPGPDGATVYRCQATQHLAATRAFKPFDAGLLLADLRSGNTGIGEMLRNLLLLVVWRAEQDLPFGWRLWNGLYTALHRLFYGTGNPHVTGTIPKGAPTPDVRIGLQPGDTVRVRSLAEIQATLNVANRNRGLAFNPEMSPFCGGTYRVLKRVNRIVDEKTGRMLDMKGPCIMLEGGYCMARYHPEAPFCPKRIPQYFREAWLERVDAGP